MCCFVRHYCVVAAVTEGDAQNRLLSCVCTDICSIFQGTFVLLLVLDIK